MITRNTVFSSCSTNDLCELLKSIAFRMMHSLLFPHHACTLIMNILRALQVFIILLFVPFNSNFQKLNEFIFGACTPTRLRFVAMKTVSTILPISSLNPFTFFVLKKKKMEINCHFSSPFSTICGRKMQKNHHGCQFRIQNTVNLHRKSPHFNLMLSLSIVSFILFGKMRFVIKTHTCECISFEAATIENSSRF